MAANGMQERDGIEMNEIEERLELSMLYDFYGALLKENQQRMFEASILDDFGYAEIAEQEGISRQGVYDAIKRASRQLHEYENKLGLVKRFNKQKEQTRQLQRELQAMGISGEEQKWKKVFALLEEIVTE
ncbi:MAG: DNA-binding protein [Lachnospiraceae bacterium]|nr:DNA-binding protein [Lachnospiraceae bacterium]